MKTKKKLTRKDKQKLSAQGICWKCGKKTLKRDKSSLKCSNCNFMFNFI